MGRAGVPDLEPMPWLPLLEEASGAVFSGVAGTDLPPMTPSLPNALGEDRREGTGDCPIGAGEPDVSFPPRSSAPPA